MSLRYNIQKNDVKTSIYFNPIKTNGLEHIKLILENAGNIDVYPNDKGANPYNTYKNVTSYIYRIISNSKFLCKGINPSYVLDTFNEADAVVIISSSMDILPNGNIFGFALINFDEVKNSIYIDVICSHVGIKGAGDILINEIQQFCRTLLMTSIYLKSVKSAISFYEKYGFVKQDTLCEHMCLMIKTINAKNGGKKRKTKRRNKKNKRVTKRRNKR